MAVEERFLLHDHVPLLFFVSPQVPRLQHRIAAGMHALLKDLWFDPFDPRHGLCPGR